MNAFHRLAYARLASERDISSATSANGGLPSYRSDRTGQPGHGRKESTAASHRSHATSNGSGSGEGIYSRFGDKDVPPLPPMSA